jgi:hypothetical protein
MVSEQGDELDLMIASVIRRPYPARRGQCERGLEVSLVGHPEITLAERSALRSAARAVDTAEQRGDVPAWTDANRLYLEMRKAAGLTAGRSDPAP